jgi:hypothetical protein
MRNAIITLYGFRRCSRLSGSHHSMRAGVRFCLVCASERSAPGASHSARQGSLVVCVPSPSALCATAPSLKHTSTCCHVSVSTELSFVLVYSRLSCITEVHLSTSAVDKLFTSWSTLKLRLRICSRASLRSGIFFSSWQPWSCWSIAYCDGIQMSTNHIQSRLNTIDTRTPHFSNIRPPCSSLNSG